MLRIESNLNINKYIHKVLQPLVVPIHQSIPGSVFQQDNSSTRTANTVPHMQPLFCKKITLCFTKVSFFYLRLWFFYSFCLPLIIIIIIIIIIRIKCILFLKKKFSELQIFSLRKEHFSFGTFIMNILQSKHFMWHSHSHCLMRN